MSTSSLHTTPASIAAALRRAADQLDLMGEVEMSPVALTINLQAVSYRSDFEQRKTTVDALSLALVGQLAETDGYDDPHHRLAFEHRGARGDCDVSVFTAGSAS